MKNILVAARSFFGRTAKTLWQGFHRHKKKILAALAAVLIGVLFTLEDESKVLVTDTTKVEVGRVRKELPVTGIIKPVEGAEVKTGSRFTGVIESLAVKIGDSVRKDQEIAKLDSREQQAECRKLEASIRKLNAELRQIKETYPLQIEEAAARIMSAEAEQRYSRLNHNRMSSLSKASAISNDEMDKAEQSLDIARANQRLQEKVKQRLEAEYLLQINSLEEAIAEAEAELASALIRLSYATITSPMDGVVSEITAQEGETLVAGLQVAHLITVLDPKRLELQMYVDENDIGQVRPGAEVAFTVEAYRDRTFKGKVDLIHPGPEIRNNIVYYRALVRLAPELALEFRPEMTARCTIVTGEVENALLIPNAAFKWLEDKQIVFVAEGGDVHPVSVVTGLEGLTHTQVLEGLEEGQVVATKLELPSPLPADWRP
ncbi:MAG: efflux RND transporter periplasmic adaptor subunit [Candidatus Adiutrix sp.]|nr:efflux RND transporter periplasmic adaptor subunit [Candidatus Adiutrix sp.]